VRSETHRWGISEHGDGTYLVGESVYQLDVIWKAGLFPQEWGDIDRAGRTRFILQPLKIDLDLILVAA